MLESTCTLPLTAELFSQALHPSTPVVAVGLSTGHVQCFRIPSTTEEGSNASDDSLLSQGRGQIETQWRTKRHKISCRTVVFSLDGEALYSAGADGLVKQASSETGQVSSKIAIPYASQSIVDACSTMHVLTPQTLLIATDQTSSLHIYDLRSPTHTFTHTKPSQTFRPHSDYISSLTALPPSAESTSGFAKQWLSTGGTTVAITDLRKGIVSQSADQDDELTASCFITGLPKRGTSVGQKAIVGDAGGVLTLWERGVWDDMDERIVIDRALGGEDEGESVETLLKVPTDVCNSTSTVAAGMGGGLVAWVQLGKNKVTEVFRHDESEAVVGLGFDVEGRMISGGGSIIKVWQQKMEDTEEEAEGEAEEKPETLNGVSHQEDSSEDESVDDSTSEEEQPRKKRRKGKDNGKSLGVFKGLD
jgi:hypothetical protein